MAERVTRVDFGRVQRTVRTAQGGIRVDARLTRSGIFEYRNPDGSTRREYRPPGEVFRRDSLETLSDAPVTELHPPGLVTPATFKDTSVGHVRSGSPRKDGRYVDASLVIQAGGTVAKVERKDLREISCGYTCDYVAEPGVTKDGRRYDGVQRNIQYNHVALGPRGWGRAGSEVALRLDGAGEAAVQVRRADDDPSPTPGPAPTGGRPPREVRTDMAETIRVDGIPYEPGSPGHLEAQRKRDERLDAQIAALTKERDKLQGELEGTKTKLDAAEKAVKEAKEQVDPARLDALVAERVALVTAAQKVLGDDYKADGKSARDVMGDAIAKAKPDTKLDGRSDDFVAGLFAALTEAATPEGRNDALGDVRRQVVDTQTNPSSGTPDERQARADMIKRDGEAWKQPTSISRSSYLGHAPPAAGGTS